MADIGDVAIALVMDRRLIGAAALKVIVSDQAHVHRLGRRPDLLLGCGCRDDRPKDYSQACRNIGLAFWPKSIAPHALSPQ
jgi:hypothetical protein